MTTTSERTYINALDVRKKNIRFNPAGLPVGIQVFMFAMLALILLGGYFSGGELAFGFLPVPTHTLLSQSLAIILFAMSYNMLLGQGGMLSFGHAVYYGFGGYAVVYMAYFFEAPFGRPGFNMAPFLPLFGGLMGVILAVILGSFSTRRAGTVFAMISLGLGQLAYSAAAVFKNSLGGEDGKSFARDEHPFIIPFIGETDLWFYKNDTIYLIIAFWFLIAVILIFLFSRTPAGRLSNAVRDNEERVEFIGYSMRSVRYLVFIGAGFFAGVAGGMSALAFESTTQSDLSNFYSGVALMAVFVGGAGFFIGPILGALIYQFFAQVLPSTLYELYLGIIFLVMVMFAPQGVAGIILMHIAFVKRWRKLLIPYGAAIIATMVAVFGLVVIAEMMHHVQIAGASDPNAHPLDWFSIDTSLAFNWIWAGAVMLAGLVGLYLIRKQVSEAWDQARETGDA